MQINGTRVTELIAERQMSIAEVSRKSGIHPTNVSRALRRGSARPCTVGKIAAALGVNVRDIWQEE